MNFKLIAILASASLAAGCQSLSESYAAHQARSHKIEHVVGNTWRISADWPVLGTEGQLAEWLHDQALAHCSALNFEGMNPLTRSTYAGKDGKGASGWLEFRCERGERVEHEYQGIKINLDPFLEGSDEPSPMTEH